MTSTKNDQFFDTPSPTPLFCVDIINYGPLALSQL